MPLPFAWLLFLVFFNTLGVKTFFQNESTLGYPATKQSEKKDKEDYTTSVARHISATDVV